MKLATLACATAVLCAMALVHVAFGQDAPASISARNGTEIGSVLVSWDAAPGAAYYRIGWVNIPEFNDAGGAENPQWLDLFNFRDVHNSGRTSLKLTGLNSGTEYAFIAAGLPGRFNNASAWTSWTYLTTQEPPAIPVCPTPGTPEPVAPPPPAPTPTPSPATLTPTPSNTPRPTPSIAPTAEPGDSAVPTATPTPSGVDYDTDDDGLIEVSNLAQLDAIRHDLDAEGVVSISAYPNSQPRRGCPLSGCVGYELVADLDFDTNGNGVADAGDAYWNDGLGWTPIGSVYTPITERSGRYHPYTGDFDGNGHTISNLYSDQRTVADASNTSLIVGLFGRARESDIRNLGLLDAELYGAHSTASLVSEINDGLITNCWATGVITVDSSGAGGLIGVAYGTSIVDSYTNVHIINPDTEWAGGGIGGLAAYVKGFGQRVTVTNSYAIGDITAVGGHIGGLIGAAGGEYGFDDGSVTIRSSYATGDVTSSPGTVYGWTPVGDSGTAHIGVGGLVGTATKLHVSDSYANGRVSYSGQNAATGGLLGSAYAGTVITSYTAGSVDAQSDAGGLIGQQIVLPGEPVTGISASYWDIETSGIDVSSGGDGKTSASLREPTAATGIYADWDADVWDFGTSSQYPALRQPFGGVERQRR